MARHEADREDLMAEATALRERVELALPGETEHVVAGFREDGRFSLYFGPDPAFHFDADGRFRRAFVAGRLYRSQKQTLARLTRSRTDEAVHLERHDLDPAELERFLADMKDHLNRLARALEENQAAVMQQIPAGADLRDKVARSLRSAMELRLSVPLKARG